MRPRPAIPRRGPDEQIGKEFVLAAAEARPVVQDLSDLSFEPRALVFALLWFRGRSHRYGNLQRRRLWNLNDARLALQRSRRTRLRLGGGTPLLRRDDLFPAVAPIRLVGRWHHVARTTADKPLFVAHLTSPPRFCGFWPCADGFALALSFPGSTLLSSPCPSAGVSGQRG